MDPQQTPPQNPNDIDARIMAERHAAEAYQNTPQRVTSTIPQQSAQSPVGRIRTFPKRTLLLVLVPALFLIGIVSITSRGDGGNNAHKTSVNGDDEEQSANGSLTGDYVVDEDTQNTTSDTGTTNTPQPATNTGSKPSSGKTPSTTQQQPSTSIKKPPVIKNPPTKPTIIGSPPVAPAPPATLTSKKTFAAATYVFTSDTTIKKLPGGETASTVIYAKNTKIGNVIELLTYSNGKQFYLTKSQVDAGRKTGFLASVMKYVPPPKPKITKVLIVVEENHSFSQMKKSMPFTFALGKKYGYATAFYATTHPSLPNYLAISAGAFPRTDNVLPSKLKIRGPTVFGRAIAYGKTAKIYAESMTQNCQTSDNSKYKVKHNPWPYYVDERTSCAKYDVPFTKFSADVSAGRLPNVGMVIPNICNDAHDCSLSTADRWFRSLITTISNGPDWKSGRLVVILTADEDDKNENNRILTVVIHPSLKGKVVTARLTHYSLTRLYSEVVGAPPLRAGANARSLSGSFGLSL